MIILKGKRWLYHGAILVMVGVTMALVIGGVNLTAKRMSAIVPQLPEYALRVETEVDGIYFDILGREFQVPLPGFLMEGVLERKDEIDSSLRSE